MVYPLERQFRMLCEGLTVRGKTGRLEKLGYNSGNRTCLKVQSICLADGSY